MKKTVCLKTPQQDQISPSATQHSSTALNPTNTALQPKSLNQQSAEAPIATQPSTTRLTPRYRNTQIKYKLLSELAQNSSMPNQNVQSICVKEGKRMSINKKKDVETSCVLISTTKPVALQKEAPIRGA